MCSGFLIIDKPKDWTSFDVVRYVRRNLKIRTIGHAGTLDPMATGVLVLLLGKATRLMDSLLTKPKVYSGHLRLGLATTTDDITGDIVKHCSVPVFDQAERYAILDHIAGKFIGRLTQVPPIYSALKIKGQRAYDIARNQGSVELTSREVDVYKSKYFFLSDAEIGFEISCSSGTYIRSIARDIGVELKLCATLAALRRISCSGFDITQAKRIEELHADTELNDNYLKLDHSKALFNYSEITETDLDDLYNGKQERLKSLVRHAAENIEFPHILTSKASKRFALLQMEQDGSIKMKCL
ncbi:MAG: tRNA pseudouridine(55) synthase TruB [Deltaproteobacteria bacterium]|nr:tRNA pseudouridine(55) synthase TruB [Deltaproteobacteria bacterium]